ncbi:hypothetical protein AGMMS5026_04250 [Endomicrobiia bacterium]|nr:hypothetical protein AGMMS49523_08450 [Endomicrobiia bacterium]GHT12792.1 hypothetical protein AGMMS49571_05370 [Endomicrobiia bacterium]GHT27671.1 hypothetical protein AGMMS49995_07150 [Endomicrobiia bacterium]GHT30307.1 hypothetical protein AGMMS5026_04250 [Endomicrobiia bacterium]
MRVGVARVDIDRSCVSKYANIKIVRSESCKIRKYYIIIHLCIRYGFDFKI